MLNSSLSKIQIAKRQQVMDAALDTFRKFGFKRVTVEEICEAASVSKATFYKYFTNKIELVSELLMETYDKAFSDFSDLIGNGATAEEIISEIFAYKIQQVKFWGDAFITDLIMSDEGLSGLLSEVTGRFNSMFINILQAAQAKGEISKDLRPDVILMFTSKIHDILKEDDLRSLFNDNAEMMQSINTLIFYGIFGKQDCGKC